MAERETGCRFRSGISDYTTTGVPAHNTFKDFLNQYGIKYIVATVKHPQTNGKIERLFCEVAQKIENFGSIEKIIHWQNVIKPHKSPDYDEPANVFWYRLYSMSVLSNGQKWLYMQN